MAKIKIELEEIKSGNETHTGIDAEVAGTDLQVFIMLATTIADFLKRKKPLLRRFMFKSLVDFIKATSNLDEKSGESLDDVLLVLAFGIGLKGYQESMGTAGGETDDE